MISIDYREEKFLVTAVIDQNHIEDKNLVGVLKRFDSPSDALHYALGVMDGIQSYVTGSKSGYFEATKVENVRLTPEAAEEMIGFATALLECSKKGKIIICHADNCSFNNNEGRCDREGDYVTIAVYDNLAQCCNYQAKGISLVKSVKKGREKHEQ